MSSLDDRSNSPRRRITRGGMMPGYFVMFTAWISGLLMLPALFDTMRGHWVGAAVLGSIAFTLLALSARKAEKLVEPSKIGGAA